jgi:tRNA threonylcarbamoyladenosine biosynthesis protein TsaE
VQESFRTGSAAETEAVAAGLATGLEAGDVVLIEGELGAGKTTFVRGACRALGVEEPVTSPTFMIGQLYEGRLPVAHLDLHRLEGLDREEPGLLDDYLDPEQGRGVTFIEWPGAAAAELDRVAARVEIGHADRDAREITITR